MQILVCMCDLKGAIIMIMGTGNGDSQTAGAAEEVNKGERQKPRGNVSWLDISLLLSLTVHLRHCWEISAVGLHTNMFSL